MQKDKLSINPDDNEDDEMEIIDDNLSKHDKVVSKTIVKPSPISSSNLEALSCGRWISQIAYPFKPNKTQINSNQTNFAQKLYLISKHFQKNRKNSLQYILQNNTKALRSNILEFIAFFALGLKLSFDGIDKILCSDLVINSKTPLGRMHMCLDVALRLTNSELFHIIVQMLSILETKGFVYQPEKGAYQIVQNKTSKSQQMLKKLKVSDDIDRMDIVDENKIKIEQIEDQSENKWISELHKLLKEETDYEPDKELSFTNLKDEREADDSSQSIDQIEKLSVSSEESFYDSRDELLKQFIDKKLNSTYEDDSRITVLLETKREYRSTYDQLISEIKSGDLQIDKIKSDEANKLYKKLIRKPIFKITPKEINDKEEMEFSSTIKKDIENYTEQKTDGGRNVFFVEDIFENN